MKNPPYFIIGLPRSRTAWLANFLTTGQSFCWHEASRYVRDVMLLPAFLHQCRSKFRGDADSALCYYPEKIMRWFPASKFVFIHRSVTDSIKSAVAQFPNIPPCLTEKSIVKCAEGFIDLNCAVSPALKINFAFEELDDNKAIREIWRFCLPGVKFNWERAEMLQQMRVDTVFSKMEAHMHPIYQAKLKEIRRIQSVMP